MEDESISIRTLLFNGLDPVCIIDYQGAEYFLGKHRVLMTKKYDFVRLPFDQLPDAVQKEYMVWRLGQ